MTEERAQSNPYGDDYDWPTSLYDEMAPLSMVSDLIYNFGIIVEAARRAAENGTTLIGFDANEGAQLTKSGIASTELQRSFTPSELKKVIEDNVSALADISGDFKGDSLVTLMTLIEKFQSKADSAEGEERPLAIEEFDDKFQKKECVYAITRDSVSKRITVVFRGSDELAFLPNWLANLAFNRRTVDVPDILKGKVDENYIKWHAGFYRYIFDETRDDNDAEGTTKYDAILADVKSLLLKYPDHKVYTTGHSLGAALSTITAFNFACDPDLPKPISCINFASPRVGSYELLDSVRYLEKNKQLRMLRSVNENDTVTTIPPVGYEHVGFQVTTYKEGWFGRIYEPDIDYKKENDGLWTKFRRNMSNGIISNLNFGYDHGAYTERINLAKEDLEKTSLNELYSNRRVVGYRLQDM